MNAHASSSTGSNGWIARLVRLSPRALLVLAVAVVSASMAGGLFVQHVIGLEPCPLCVLQRVGFIGCGAIALAGALLARGPRGQLAATGLAAVPALGGGGVAVWHNWLVLNPPESMTCGRPFEWFHEDFPLAVWLPKLFRGAGDCLHNDWTLLGLSVPQWAIVMFAILLATLLVAALRAWRALTG